LLKAVIPKRSEPKINFSETRIGPEYVSGVPPDSKFKNRLSGSE
jgi:hypothetical protein